MHMKVNIKCIVRMKNSCAVLLLAFAFSSCKVPLRTGFQTGAILDSLSVSTRAFNLSEDLTGNDELLLMCYVHNDTTSLSEPVFSKRFTLNPKINVRQFAIKVNEDLVKSPLILFLIEQDSDLPVAIVDSTLRVSHRAIRKEFAARNYTGIESYLKDEDILGIKVISSLPPQEALLTNFTGIYKLDKFEYQVSIKCRFR
jgi:hypothetical protein